MSVTILKIQILTGLIIFFALSSQIVANSPVASASKTKAALVGEIIDIESGEKLGWTTLLIEELNRSVTAHSDGSFHFFGLPGGTYTLKSFRVGYQNSSKTIRVGDQDTTHIVLKMKAAPVSGEAIIVEALRQDQTLSDLQQPVVEVSGKNLRQNLGNTIAETIEDEPGLATRTMGPAPARPVLRGLSGDRLLVLEDGGRTGDLSATSSDHAVVIEPMTAERIEVIRGPEALQFGGSTLGGVVNVVRNYVPTNLPHRLNGSASFQGQSVNSGYSGGAEFNGSLGTFAYRADGSYRSSQDVNTPQGSLLNTGLENLNGSLGASLIRNWGFLGAAGGYYESQYGIPPDPYGGHPNGVTIDLKRTHFESQTEIYPNPDCICRFNVKYNYSRYQHTEFESNGAVGIKFGLLTHNLSATMRTRELGIFTNGIIGLWGEYRDYATGGLSFTPPTKEYSAAGYVYQETHFGDFMVNASLRFDVRLTRPSEEKIIEREDFTLFIRDRSFSGISGAVSGHYHMSKHWATGLSFMRSFRSPTIEELFSEGPHLAAYAYEVGNSELDTEKGIGLETFFEYHTEDFNWDFAVFYNNISGYIYPKNTGRFSLRRADLLVYQHVGENVTMTGFETTLNWRLSRKWTAGGNLSFVVGERTEVQEPLAQIPPLGGKLRLNYNIDSFTLSGHLHFAGPQDRLGENENLFPVLDSNGNLIKDISGDPVLEQRSTENFVVMDLSAEYLFSTGAFLNTLSFSIENIFDTEYRKHLNRVKQIMPEPGRNFKILYKMFF